MRGNGVSCTVKICMNNSDLSVNCHRRQLIDGGTDISYRCRLKKWYKMLCTSSHVFAHVLSSFILFQSHEQGSYSLYLSIVKNFIGILDFYIFDRHIGLHLLVIFGTNPSGKKKFFYITSPRWHWNKRLHHFSALKMALRWYGMVWYSVVIYGTRITDLVISFNDCYFFWTDVRFSRYKAYNSLSNGFNWRFPVRRNCRDGHSHQPMKKTT